MHKIFSRSRTAGEEGFALVTVMLALMALSALSIAIVEYAVGSQVTSKRDQNWNAALSAAQAGVNDYLHRVNSTSNYASLYGNTGSQTKDPANPAMTDFTPVNGSVDEQFRYWVDSAGNQQSLAKSGSVSLTVTGKVGNAARTLLVSLRVATYLDYLYYTDLEIADPLIATSQGSLCAAPRHSYTQGSVTGYDTTGSNPNSCSLIYFYGTSTRQDVINGPLHTNDRLRVCGTPQFKGEASTSYPGYTPTSATPVKPGDKLWLGNTGCSNNPQFLVNADTTNIDYGDTIPPLPSNSALKTYTGGATGGCYYTGPTSIVFNSTGGSTAMTVWSPTTTTASPGCPLGNGATAASAQSGKLPDNGVIYVDNTTSSKCSGQNNKNLLGYPKNGDVTTPTKYQCTDGDAFVQGNLNGQVTIGANHDIVVTGDVLYHDKAKGSTSYQGTDILGLIANRFVSVYHPVDSSGNEVAGFIQNPEIDGAILSVQHSFWNQSYAKGAAANLGTLTVFGAIAQEYRGPVGTFNGSTGASVTGYIKNYNYDNRLKYLAPPYFLNPTATAFQQSTWKELVPRLS